MLKHWFAKVLFICALAIAVPMLADQGKGKGHGKGNPHNNQASDRDDRDDRWERRGDYEYRTYGEHEGVPPGWSKGKKTGWGNCGLPPGQAKKYGCQSYRYGGRDYYYYRDDAGRIIVRRPSIHVHGGIDVH
jgi:hypothetical protein